MKCSRKPLRLEKKSGETVMCRQGLVNTRLSGLFAALFTGLFCLNVDGSVSPRLAHQVLVPHASNVLACYMISE